MKEASSASPELFYKIFESCQLILQLAQLGTRSGEGKRPTTGLGLRKLFRVQGVTSQSVCTAVYISVAAQRANRQLQALASLLVVQVLYDVALTW